MAPGTYWKAFLENEYFFLNCWEWQRETPSFVDKTMGEIGAAVKMHTLVTQGKAPVPVVVFLGPKQRSGSETLPGWPGNPRDKDRTTSDFKVQLSAMTPFTKSQLCPGFCNDVFNVQGKLGGGVCALM